MICVSKNDILNTLSVQQKLRLLVIFIFIFNIGFTQSKIEKAEESLKQKDNSDSNVKFEDNDSYSTDTDTTFLEETIGNLFIEIFAYTVYGILVESPFEKGSLSSSAILTKYPYFNSNNGNYNYGWNENSVVGRTSISSRYVLENSRIQGNHLNFDFHFYNKIGLELDYLQLWENSPNWGENSLALYKMLFKYHRVRTKHFNGWWGIGGTYVDGTVNQWGFTYALGMELFLGKPISIESNFHQILINEQTINTFNGLVNYHINQYKLSGGYEHLRIGSQNFSTISIGLGVCF